MARLANKIMEAFVGLRVDDSELAGDVARTKGKIGEQFAQAGTTAGQKFKAAFSVAASHGATGAYNPYSGAGGVSGGGFGVDGNGYNPYGGGGFTTGGGGFGGAAGMGGGGGGGILGGVMQTILLGIQGGLVAATARIFYRLGNQIDNRLEEMHKTASGNRETFIQGQYNAERDAASPDSKMAIAARKRKEAQEMVGGRDNLGWLEWLLPKDKEKAGFFREAALNIGSFLGSGMPTRKEIDERSAQLTKDETFDLQMAEVQARKGQTNIDRNMTANYVGRIAFSVERFADFATKGGRR